MRSGLGRRAAKDSMTTPASSVQTRDPGTSRRRIHAFRAWTFVYMMDPSVFSQHRSSVFGGDFASEPAARGDRQAFRTTTDLVPSPVNGPCRPAF